MVGLGGRMLGLVLAVAVSALAWKAYMEAGTWARGACLVLVGAVVALLISEVDTEASSSQG